MEINIDLNKSFVDTYNKLHTEYGEPLAKLNGFSNRQLNYTEFIDNFIDKETVADASIDGNANVGNKDIVTLLSEMAKPHQKLLAAHKIYYEMGKKYDNQTAIEWFENEYKGYSYLHDFPTSTFVHYCFAYDLKDLAEKGLFFIDNFNFEPPKHLVTFVDFVKEFISYTCTRSSGAVGLPNLIPYLYYFWDRDVKVNYWNGSPEKYAKQNVQRVIYALNQPFLRGTQSAFTNTSIFDRPYLEALFGGATFPDGAFMIDELDGIMEFQKMFLEEMSRIRSKNMMTFPVNSISLLYQNGKFVDEEFARWACAHNMKWSDSNFFIDDSVTSLSNCCFDGSQLCVTKSSEGVNYMSFQELYNSNYKDTKKNFTIFHNGNWVKGRIVKLPGRKMYRILTANNKELILTDNHINATIDGDKTTASLTENDYLLFNTKPLEAVHEVDANLTYEQGFVIGMSLGQDEYQNKEKCPAAQEPVAIKEKKIYNFIHEFYSHEKHLNPDCILQSVECRKGILDGFCQANGDNNNRIYSVSSRLIDDIEMLCTSLGLQTVIDVSEEKTFNSNYPVYCIQWYDTDKSEQKDVYKWKNNSIYFKIKSIEEMPEIPEYVYCFEMENQEEPYFTLANGIITHNCRLKSDINELGYFNSVGGTALKVGSVKVNTVNLARLALENDTEDKYIENLKKVLDLTLKSLDCVRHIIKRNVDKGLLKNFSLGIVDFEHLYNTVGVIGIYEAIKKFGYTKTDELGNTYYTDEAFAFGKKIFDTIHAVNAEFAKDKGYKINVEQIPGETAASKLMQKDLIFHPDTTVTDLPLYGNQFIPLGITTTLQERMRIASAFDSFCNGGSIWHCNIEAPFNNFEQAWKMLNYVAEQGITYFAFNTKIQACKHNHGFYGKTCPECGEPVETEYSRIVGFYVPIKTYSKERKAEYSMRKWMDVNNVD